MKCLFCSLPSIPFLLYNEPGFGSTPNEKKVNGFNAFMERNFYSEFGLRSLLKLIKELKNKKKKTKSDSFLNIQKAEPYHMF